LGLNNHAQGQNVIVAFSTLSGMTQEDAFVLKKEAIERGLFRYQKTLIIRAKIEGDDVLGKPELNENNKNAYRYIEANGLPMIGAFLRKNDAVVGIIRTTKSGERRNASVLIMMGEAGFVTDVRVSGHHPGLEVKVQIRVTRAPQVGDKLASRYAQKGTIGKILPSSELPRTRDGIVPDVIVNPHAFISRMTCGLLLEVLAGKYAALTGDRVDASAFRYFDEELFKRMLLSHGFQPHGEERMTYRGKPLAAQIYIGPCYFQLLKHIADDKIQQRGRGSVTIIAHQPVKGARISGGLRFGEMERDAAIAFGVAAFTRERLCGVSDAYRVVVCLTCGTIARNTIEGYHCDVCNSSQNFGVSEFPYALKYIIQFHQLFGNTISLKFKTLQEVSKNIESGRPHGYSPGYIKMENPNESLAAEEEEEEDEEDESNDLGFDIETEEA
jgi:DNA-directed RNA polymerase II subunit RPB2